ncbi:lysyl oxidase [Krasilnikovia cinnamomea]|uniref:Lysyl oxidase n=1 Tax=Krasilnikovia cinnamomea TaxID=349313 RepID=A0A4Q7ZM90_9ACTN|nr:lysyl oxidase family protein [Krasilnikovia cinnamomea]RZU52100.1 lysyl oxidase [Krasilnikovia cinnamomea]
MSNRLSRRARTRLLVAGAVTTAVAAAAAGVGVATAAADPPALAFVSATPNVTAERHIFSDGSWFNVDLGVNLIAGKNPFEIRASRKSYADPIVAQQFVTEKGKTKKVNLPAGMVTNFEGLRNFTTITVKDTSGKQVKQYQQDFCPNGWDTHRTRPDAPAESPYPQSCNGSNPFTLGAVWGIQAGWNAPVANDGYRGDSGNSELDLPVGDYAVTVELNKTYRDFFKIPAKSASVQLNMKVVEIKESEGEGDGPNPSPSSPARLKAKDAKAARAQALRAEAAAPGDEHSVHGGEGVESKQIAGYLPAFRPPAKAPQGALRSTAQAPKGPRPDLRSLPAWDISLEEGTDGVKDGKWYINFGATVWNAGPSTLLVDGFRRTGTELMDAYQYFFDNNGKQVGSAKAGTMEWDNREGHKHWHFTDFAQYNLLKADKKLAVRSGKEAFCLANTDAIDYTVPGAKWRPENTDLSTACGGNTAVAVREVLDSGNGDTYSQARPGQSFEVTDLPNGTYYIEVKANPENKLAESSTTNNTSLRKVILGGTPQERTLTVPSVYGLD